MQTHDRLTVQTHAGLTVQINSRWIDSANQLMLDWQCKLTDAALTVQNLRWTDSANSCWTDSANSRWIDSVNWRWIEGTKITLDWQCKLTLGMRVQNYKHRITETVQGQNISRRQKRVASPEHTLSGTTSHCVCAVIVSWILRQF